MDELIKISSSLLSKLGEGEGSTSGVSLSLSELPELGGVSSQSVGSASDSHDSGVDGARHAVMKLHVDLGHVEVALSEGRALSDISLGGSIHHVSHLESLDGLVFAHKSAAVDASNHVVVSLVVLVSTVVSSLRRHI